MDTTVCFSRPVHAEGGMTCRQLITNSVRYSAPSDSEDENTKQDQFTLQSHRRAARLAKRRFNKAQQDLARICSSPDFVYNERLHPHIVFPLYTDDKAWLEQRAEYLTRLAQLRHEEYEQQRKRHTEEMKKLRAVLANIDLSNHDEEENEDKAFEDDVKERLKRIEKAIADDKKKHEEALAKEKAKVAEKKEEQEKLQKEADQKKKDEDAVKQKKDRAAKMAQSTAVSPQGLEEYKKHLAKIEWYKSTIYPKLKTNDAFRKQCFEARRFVKRTLGQIQFRHDIIVQKYNALAQFLAQTQRQSVDVFHVLLNYVAKTLLLQVQTETRAAPFSAYFLARFAMLVCATIPDFTDYLLGRLGKRCPYLIPQYHDSDPSLSVQEIKSRLRYIYADKSSGRLETFIEHAERQKCFIMFYAALIQTKPDPGQPANPFSIGLGWTWLARICNMPSREITPMLVHAFLEFAGKRMLETYPRQLPKVLRLIRTQILPSVPIQQGNDNVAAIKSFELYLDEYFATGQLESAPEALAPKV